MTMHASGAAAVVVVGSLNMDLVARVARLPQPGETLAGLSFDTVPGGKGANQAVATARLGASVAMVGCIGDDAHGEALRANLLREGVDCGGLVVRAGQKTGVAIIMVDQHSQNNIVIIPGSNGELSPAHVAGCEAALAAAQLLICQLEVPLATVECAVKTARRHGKQVLLNPAPAYPLPASLLAQVDYLIPNEVEAAMLSGMRVDSPQTAQVAAAHLRAQGCRNVLITLGAQGVLAATPSGVTHYPAPQVRPVDTTAAGDTFIGGFAAALVGSASIDEAIRFGQQAAALSVTRGGAQTSIPHRHEIPYLT
jgi:ribokinase